MATPTLTGIGGAPIGGAAIGGTPTSTSLPGSAFSASAFLLLEHDGRTYLLTSQGATAMSDFWLAKGDLLPTLFGQMVDANLDPINLTGATVRFRAISRDTGLVVIDQPASVIDALGGRVSYPWAAADTAAKAELLARMEAVIATGQPVKTPNVGYIALHIGN